MFKILKNKKLVNIILVALMCTGVYLMASLVHELTVKNYGFYGNHHDFIAFYTAAKLALNQSASSLYDADLVTAFQRTIIPHAIGATGYMPYLNPPFLAVLLSPLSIFNITTARLVWLVITVLMALSSFYILTGALTRKQRWLVVTALFLTFPVYQTLIEGQVTILVLLCATLAYKFFKESKKFIAGLFLAGLWVFPQYALMVLIVLIYKRQWQMVKGWMIASIALFLFTLPSTGFTTNITYIKQLSTVTQNHFIDQSTSKVLTWRGNLDSSLGINGFITSLLRISSTTANNAIYLLAASALVSYLALTAYKLKHKYTKEQGVYLYCASILTAMLISPHVFGQGIVFVFLMLPALLSIYKKHYLLVVAGMVALVDLAYIDQSVRFHFYTFFALLMTIFLIYKSTNKKPA